MKHCIEIVLDPYLEDSIDSALTEIQNAIDDMRKYHPKGVSTFVDIDIHNLLAQHRAIAIVLGIQHVKDQRPDLNDEQAWKVLQNCQQAHERLMDPMLENIRQIADSFYPQQCQARQPKAAAVIAGYGNGDQRENLVDLLADAIHWCQVVGAPFDELCATARLHFAAEINPPTKGIKP